ncbi:hypothetical protein GF402_09865 [Candidatus Fermentibacteria bacterium]|nr:hypothetical protein [Candidatus Fermentibacteria bacterium]
MSKMLEGLGWHPLWTTHIGCLQGCAEFMGSEVPVAWLFGATGHAFVINVHDRLCPSGPTAWDTRMILELSPNVGIRQTNLFGEVGKDDPRGLRKQAWQMVRGAIDDGRPCFGWELDIPEFYVIYGYDEEGYFFSGPMCDGGKDPKPWKKLGDSEIGVLEVYCCEPCQPASDEATVKQALQAALRHADDADGLTFEGYNSGPRAFEAWRESIEDANELPWGVAYNTEVWSECRYFAAKFTEMAADRLGSGLSTDLERVSKLYSRVQSSLLEVGEVYPFHGPDENPEVDDGGRRRAVRALTEAYDAERKAVEVLRGVCDRL